MSYDLVIRNGEIVDGTGLSRFRADLAAVGDRIVKVGRITERGRREIDAEGCVVTPGFIDGHTHMDAQMFWDPLGTSSCWHGVTTVVTGNCGFTLAPGDRSKRDLLFRNFEGAEDLAFDSLVQGIPTWSWNEFDSYLDVLDSLPKGINCAANVGHSALRIAAMGERAFDETASDDHVRTMERLLEMAMRAGAIGFTSSRSSAQVTGDGRPVASRLAEWSEVTRLVGLLGELGVGLFELAPEDAQTEEDQEARGEWFSRLQALAVQSGVPVTFGLFSSRAAPNAWRHALEVIEETAAAGGRMFAQSHCRDISYLPSFRTKLPFDGLAIWKDVRELSLEEQRKAYSDPHMRDQLIASAHAGPYSRLRKRPPDYDQICVLRSPLPDRDRSIAEEARVRGVDPVEAMIDLALETNFDQMFRQPSVNIDLDHVLEILRSPRNVMTFSDAGAHVSYIVDSSIQTTLLAYWVRERKEFTLEEAVQMITLAPARAWGFSDRGLIREGMIADLNVIDPEEVGPEMPVLVNDLPGGSPRLMQRGSGIRATIVAGETVHCNGEHTGDLPGRLIRGPLAGAR